MARWSTFVRNDSGIDINFAFTSTIELDDWRQAQVVINTEAPRKYAGSMSVKFLEEANTVRECFFLPSTALVREAEKTADAKAFISAAERKYAKVYKYGLEALGSEAELRDLGFDAVLDVLESCYCLFEMDEPDKEIKYQCTCPSFWHYYKCRHSLALSILKKGVQIPPIYNITAIGPKKTVGRPKNAVPGNALVVPAGVVNRNRL